MAIRVAVSKPVDQNGSVSYRRGRIILAEEAGPRLRRGSWKVEGNQNALGKWGGIRELAFERDRASGLMSRVNRYSPKEHGHLGEMGVLKKGVSEHVIGVEKASPARPNSRTGHINKAEGVRRTYSYSPGWSSTWGTVVANA